MSGGLIQLVAYGAQDVYLTGNPNITFFKVVYRRHTNFAVESIEQTFNGNLQFARRTSAEISRNGDLITKVYLKLEIPEVRYEGPFDRIGHVEFAWVRRLGHAIIDETELEVGGTQIDKQYGTWLNIWYDLSHEVGHEYGYAKMIGDVPELTSISCLSWDCDDNLLKPSYCMYVPLQFYFCRNNGLALPLIALQYHVVKIYVRLRSVDHCFVASEAFRCGCPCIQLNDASLFVNYIYLDTEERRRFAQVSHEYLVEQLQFTGEESIGNSNSNKFKLVFNHPCKALYWVVRLGNYEGGRFMVYDECDWERARCHAAELLLLAQYDLNQFGYFNEVACTTDDSIYTADSGIEYLAVNPADSAEEPRYTFCDSATAAHFDGSVFIGRLVRGLPLLRRNKDCDLRDKVDGIIRISTDFDNDNLTYPEVDRVTRNTLTFLDLSIPICRFDCDNRCPYVREYDVIVYMWHNFGLLINGNINPVSEVQLQLNGQDRQTKRSGFWHDTVVPYENFTDTPRDGVNVYSFALNPEEHQPSGTCNFSRIDTATLNLWFFNSLANGRYCDVFMCTDNKVLIYAVNYNVARILSGMMGLAYSN